MSFAIKKIHHVAYRCKDAKETVEWYKKMLNMDFILAFAEDHVPSTNLNLMHHSSLKNMAHQHVQWGLEHVMQPKLLKMQLNLAQSQCIRKQDQWN